MSNKNKYGHKSYESAFSGVQQYLATHQDLEKTVRNTGSAHDRMVKTESLVKDFLKEKKLPVTNDQMRNANVVQDNWNEFKNWLEE